MFVSACGLLGKKDYPDPQDTLDKLMEAMVDGDMDAVKEITGEDLDFDYSDYDDQTKDIMIFYFEQMSAEVKGDPKYKGKKVELTVTFTVPNFTDSMSAVIDNETNDFLTLKVKDLLLASLNGEDTTAIEEQMLVDFFEEVKTQMADSKNQSSKDSTMTMVLNDDEDGWIIDEMDEDFIDPAALDTDSIEISSAIEQAVTDAVPGALDLLLEEGSIDQATYDALIAAF